MSGILRGLCTQRAGTDALSTFDGKPESLYGASSSD
jgi:hypothetical protein